ncbi:alpha/beta-hydrolase [Xylariaceae sp. FL0594]|nr:alpha/beta-hydrolase [Xylariaceae sp. FL0594]
MGVEAFLATMPHHVSLAVLWESKWRDACLRSVYPFHDGHFGDFEPIFISLMNSGWENESSAYTREFIQKGLELEKKGDQVLAEGQTEEASKLYLRAACVLRIGRFPYITSFPTVNCQRRWSVWVIQKAVYMKAAELWEAPIEDVRIPHACKKGQDRDTIPAYVRVPAVGEQKSPFPTVLLLTGLDGYRPDNTTRLDEFTKRGWASVVVEIPGTAECPADPADPESPDRLWDSLFQWMERDGRFDMQRVMCWGLSAGGFYAVRIAHTHPNHLIGCVAQGAGTHHFLSPAWLECIDRHEYPFTLLPSLAKKYGYNKTDDFVIEAQKKFSLVETEIVNRKSTRLLLVNGTLDGLMPIEDSMLMFEYGTPKEASFVPGALHMGYPSANDAIYPWMEKVMTTEKSEIPAQPQPESQLPSMAWQDERPLD